MRYPVERIKYCKAVGVARVGNIAEILRSFGFRVVTREPEAKGVDVWVYKNDNLVLVIEVTNWREDVYMDVKRAQSIRNNFRKYNSPRKLLVSSFEKNYIKQKSCFEDLNVDYQDVGFQTQTFYPFYKSQGLASGMRPNTPATRKIVKRKIKAYLKRIGLI